MSLDTIPRLLRTEAEQVAEHVWMRWAGDGRHGLKPSFETPELRADFVQEVFRQCANAIEARPDAEVKP